MVKASENAISTLIWLVVGLHLVGLLPGLLEAMDSLAISVGDTRISLLAVIKLLLLMGLLLVVAIWLSGIIDRRLSKEARVWVADPEAGFGSVRSDINLEIWRRFKQEGLTIPFPQQDLYIKEVPAK
ncbi:hypothetical protein [Marinobacter gelidimuriae]|uniref:hypothetical protein n=1 Tax=Marinobacter gelidimuriae TaxID=2739064 RepID=UPI000375728C|nr:hypothetical protein [Marinobacter gelidimuriae]